jgi:hypothetical protein
MMLPRRRLAPGHLALALVLGVVPAARAQLNPTNPTQPPTTSTDTTGLNLTKEDFLLRLQRPQGKGFVYMTQTESALFFNRARCQCQAPFRLLVDLTAAGRKKLSTYRQDSAIYKIRVGNAQCVASDNRPTTAHCEDFPRAGDGSVTAQKLTGLVRNTLAVDLTVDRMYASATAAADGGAPQIQCDRDFKQTVWVWVDTNGDSIPDLGDASAPSIALDLDGAGPPPPGEVKVRGGQEALEVSWKALESATDFDGYLVFCARAGVLPVFNPSPFKSQYYQTPLSVCPDGVAGGLVRPLTQELTAEEGTSVPVPAPLRQLDPAFLCADRLTSQTKARIFTLQNQVPYVVGVASVDKKGNASSITSAFLQSPVPTVDFYRGYRNDGGEAEGGFCALAPGRYAGRHRAAALGTIAGGLTFALLRRLRRTRRARGGDTWAP